MPNVLNYLQQRNREPWLLNWDTAAFTQKVQTLYHRLYPFTLAATPPKVLISCHNSLDFLTAFLAAVAADCSVFLGDPAWVAAEWQETLQLVEPDLILSDGLIPDAPSLPRTSSIPPRPISPIIAIPTGGSSGRIRFAIHTWESLRAAVKGFQAYFALKSINSFCILPLYHVSGLMQFLRSFLTGGRIAIVPYAALKTPNLPTCDIDLPPEAFYISLVPTQLRFLLEHHPHWLSRFATVFLGGAAAGQELLDIARQKPIRLAPTYGMTETAAQVVTLKPEEFLQGNSSCGRLLPHARITICDDQGTTLDLEQTGIVKITCSSLFHGYYSKDWTIDLPHKPNVLMTDDLGYFDTEGYLHIVGRNSQKIITGGKNVFPAEVEWAILSSDQIRDACIIGMEDDYWGQIIVAICVPRSNNWSEFNLAALQQEISPRLSKYKHPKHWVFVAQLPRNLQGKINYVEVMKLAKMTLKN
jgi:o-succinylbenzoate---CoA ligase